MSKRSSLEKVIEALRKGQSRARELCGHSTTNGEFYFYDSIAEHLGEVIHEVARINDLLKL
jgi:hypothetical protein